jgi:hypothetical protein
MTKLIWHIDRAKFSFHDSAEYDAWKGNKAVRFEWAPSQADDPGESLFEDPFEIELDFKVAAPDSVLKMTLEEDGPVISAWVSVNVETTDDFSEEGLEEWAAEEGGWASATIYLDDVDAEIVEDDGGEWRIG